MLQALVSLGIKGHNTPCSCREQPGALTPSAGFPPSELRETEAQKKKTDSWSAVVNNSYQGCSTTAREIQGLDADVSGITGRRDNTQT